MERQSPECPEEDYLAEEYAKYQLAFLEKNADDGLIKLTLTLNQSNLS